MSIAPTAEVVFFFFKIELQVPLKKLKRSLSVKEALTLNYPRIFELKMFFNILIGLENCVD